MKAIDQTHCRTGIRHRRHDKQREHHPRDGTREQDHKDRDDRVDVKALTSDRLRRRANAARERHARRLDRDPCGWVGIDLDRLRSG
jgi:hypothetical protein